MASKEFSGPDTYKQIKAVGDWIDQQEKRVLFSHRDKGVAAPTIDWAYLVNNEPLVVLDASSEWNDETVAKFVLHCSEKHAEAMESAGVLSFSGEVAKH